MIRSLLQGIRARIGKGQQGYTLVEVIASVVILGIIIVPLGTAMVVGFRTVVGIQERLAGSADVQQLSTYFPSDVASVDTDGVNPTTVDDQGVCKASPTEESLITFRWDQDLGTGGQTVVRYLGRGSGIDSELVRRSCRGSAAPVEIVLAKHFGTAGSAEAATFLKTEDAVPVQTPVCGLRSCSIDIHGAFDFHLSAQRRVEGENGSGRPPGAPTNVHALGGFNRVRLFWTAPLDTGGQPITGYYVEQNGVLVGGSNPVVFGVSAGTPPGALIDGLANNQSYIFRVRATTIIGNGPWSAYSPSVTPGPTTPEPPKLDTATGDAAINGRINATWSLPSDYSNGGAALTGFRLTANDPDSSPTVVTFNNPSTVAGAVTALQDNTRYSVLVSALNSYGEGSPSTSINDVLTLPGPPGTPTAAGSGTAGTVVLTFTPPTEGEFTDFTNFRAKVGATNSSAVTAATACATSSSCTLTVSGVNVSSSTTVWVQAQNATGWGTLSAPLTIPADTTAPTVAFTFPSKPAYNSSSWDAGCGGVGGAVCGTASDAAPGGVASVALTVRRSSDNKYWNGSAGTGNGSGQPWNSSAAVNLTATGTTAWSRALTTASLTNGETYTIVVTAKDSLNQSGTATRTFAYVTGAPTGSITTPANTDSVRGTITVASNSAATSPATVESADFQYKPSASSTWTSIGIDVAGPPWNAAWDTTVLPNGSYDLRVITTDTASNTFTSLTVTVTVDNTAPTGTLTAPADGAIVRGSSVTVSSNSADTGGAGVADATFQRSPTGAGSWTTIGVPDTSSPYSVAWNTTSGTPDGLYDLRVVTTDDAGNSFTSPTRTVNVDNTSPSITPNVVGTLGTNG
jgi:prepilin-type N-terminal cleavage/methylation domain-containing protein